MPHAGPSVVVLLPVFNDWQALSLLLPKVASHLSTTTSQFGILIIDDGSSIEPHDVTPDRTAPGAIWVRVVRLRRNLGHQRAIAIGLSYIDEHVPCDAVIVMDADGEDRPDDLPALLERFERESRTRIVFAERRRRAEGVMFVAFYQLYRVLHRMLTGGVVRVGNFSVIPSRQVSSLVTVSALWIHYAAAAMRSRQPLCMVPTQRGRRLDGQTRMNFVSLVVHGLSAISVYSDVVFTRLVVGAAALTAASLGAMVAVVGIRLLTTLAVPGWATYSVGLLLIVLLQSVTFVVSLTFLTLGSRQSATMLPCRDYRYYVADVRPVDSSPQPGRDR